MRIDTTKAISSITYNGVNIPLQADEINFKAMIERPDVIPAGFSLPSDLTSIGNYAFYQWTNFNVDSLPSGITTIGSSAFQSCTGLTSITLPASVSLISSQAFQSCTGLTSVTYEGKVPNITTMMFYNCNAIAKYDFRNCITIPTLASTTSLGHASGCQIIVPDALYDNWIIATNWSALTNVVFVKASEYVE